MANSIIISTRPSFAARRFGSNQSFPPGATTTILFNDKLIDTHNQYNPSTGVFTCTIPGIYQFNTSVRFAGATGNLTLALVQIEKNSLVVRGQEFSNLTTNVVAVSQSYLSQLIIGDTIKITTVCNTTTGNINIEVVSNSFELAHFSGFKIE